MRLSLNSMKIIDYYNFIFFLHNQCIYILFLYHIMIIQGNFINILTLLMMQGARSVRELFGCLL